MHLHHNIQMKIGNRAHDNRKQDSKVIRELCYYTLHHEIMRSLNIGESNTLLYSIVQYLGGQIAESS